MSSYLNKTVHSVFLVTCIALLFSCKEQNTGTTNTTTKTVPETKKTKSKKLSKEFKNYWYAGNAEITSYQLEQARYGELRQGTAVLIYVTEPFMPNLQVKADSKQPNNIPVLKLNTTKNFLTGIYPYSIMTSSFYPVKDDQHAVKVSFSSQEWCGQVYAQLNNRDDFEIQSHSYFASEADQDIVLNKTSLEDEIWNKIRINPSSLPQGSLQMIPSFEYIRLTHKELRAYSAMATLNQNDVLSTYEINYPELSRTLTITFSSKFPYTIEKWTDAYRGGYGQEAKVLVSTATKIEKIKTPYWSQNKNKDLYLRDTLGL